LLQIYGNATFTGGMTEFNFINGFHATAGDKWDFFFSDSIIGWNLLSFTVNDPGQIVSFSVIDITGGKELLITQAQPVPIPPSMLLFASGLIGLIIRKCRDEYSQ